MKKHQFKIYSAIIGFSSTLLLFGLVQFETFNVLKVNANTIGDYVYETSPFEATETTLGNYTKTVEETNTRSRGDWNFVNASYKEDSFCFLGAASTSTSSYITKVDPTYGLRSITVDYTSANTTKGLVVQTKYNLEDEFTTAGTLQTGVRLDIEGNYFRIFVSSSSNEGTTISKINLNYACEVSGESIDTSSIIKIEAEDTAINCQKVGTSGAYNNCSKDYLSGGAYVPFSNKAATVTFVVESNLATTADIDLGLITASNFTMANALTLKHNAQTVTINSGTFANCGTWNTVAQNSTIATVNLVEGLNVFELASVGSCGDLDYILVKPTNKEATLVEAENQILADSSYIETALNVQHKGNNASYLGMDILTASQNSNATISFYIEAKKDLNNEPLYVRMSNNNAVQINTLFKVTVNDDEDSVASDTSLSASSGTYQLHTAHLANLTLDKGVHKITVTYIGTEKAVNIYSFMFDLNNIGFVDTTTTLDNFHN